MWGNRRTLAAIKGRPVTLVTAPHTTAESELDWPEDIEPHLYERLVQ
jgi:hypothetical protein